MSSSRMNPEKMHRTKPVVAIDGPAGAGKSTLARQLAKALGFTLIDTGALYRGAALCAKEVGADLDDEDAVLRAMALADLELKPAPAASRVFVNGVDRSDDIRTPELSVAASRVSRLPGVRAALLDLQRELGAEGGVVMEGRDIGTEVFPDAEVKLFLTASLEERVRRRAHQLSMDGVQFDQQRLRQEIEERDLRDRTRSIAPLRMAEDAIAVDSSERDEASVLTELLGHVRAWQRDS